MHQKISFDLMQVWSCAEASSNEWILIPQNSIYCPICGKILKEDIDLE